MGLSETKSVICNDAEGSHGSHMLQRTLLAAVWLTAAKPARVLLPRDFGLGSSGVAGGKMSLPSLISFHLIKPTLTHPALATATKGTKRPRRPRVDGERLLKRGTMELSPTARPTEVDVALA